MPVELRIEKIVLLADGLSFTLSSDRLVVILNFGGTSSAVTSSASKDTVAMNKIERCFSIGIKRELFFERLS